MLKFIVLRKILNWGLVVFCCMGLTVKGSDNKNIESMSVEDLKQELSMVAKRKYELKHYYTSFKEKELQEKTKAFEGKVGVLAQESAKKKEVDVELGKVRDRVEGLYASLSRKTKEFWDKLKGVESKTATKEDLLGIKNEVNLQAKAFEGKVGMLAQDSIGAAKKTEVSKQFKELEKRINLLSMTIDRYKNDSNISGEFEKRLGVYGNDLRSLSDDLSTVLGKIDDFNKFKLSRASKTEVEDKVAEVREKVDFLSGDLHNYMKEMNSDISKTIDKKLTTTENLIRSDVDSKFNHLQRQLDFIKGQMAQSNIPLNVKSVGTTSNSTDTIVRKDEISRLIKSAVKRHMHLAQENLRPKKEYYEERPVRVRRPRYRPAPVYEEDYYD